MSKAIEDIFDKFLNEYKEWYYSEDSSLQELKEIKFKALSALKKVVEARLETLIKDRYLKKDNLQYWLGWVEGHKIAVKEAKEIIAQLFDTEE